MKPIKWIVLFALLPLAGCEFNQLAGSTGGYTVPSSSSAGASSAMTAGTFTSSGNFATSSSPTSSSPTGSSVPELPDYTDPATGVIYRGDANGDVYWASGIDQTVASPIKISLFGDINGISVRGVSGGALSGQQNLTTVVLPDTYTEIQDFAFAVCPLLQDINLPADLSFFGQGVFSGCTALASLSISSNNGNFKTSDDYRGLYSKDGTSLYAVAAANLTSFTVPSGVTWLSSYLFHEYSSLIEIVLPEGISQIGTETFSCTGLRSIALPSTVSRIDGNPFRDCSQLCSFSFPKGNSFYGTDGASLYRRDSGCLLSFALIAVSGTYTIPRNITSIGESAFEHAGITGVSFPNGLTGIEDRAFEESDLVSIEFPSSLTELGFMTFAFCSSLVSADLSRSALTSLPFETFAENQKLETVTLPPAVTTLGIGCFQQDSKLGNMTLPKSVTSIQVSCFADDTGIGKLYFEGTIADWSKVTLGQDWHARAGFTEVLCADGSVAL